MSLLEAIAFLIVCLVAGTTLFLLAMALGAAAEWLVMRVKDYAANRQ